MPVLTAPAARSQKADKRSAGKLPSVPALTDFVTHDNIDTIAKPVRFQVLSRFQVPPHRFGLISYLAFGGGRHD